MKNGWKKSGVEEFIKTYNSAWPEDLALLAYATRLVGRVSDLAMHGGGNTSCKGTFPTASGDKASALFIKPSGADMGKISPADFIVMDLDYLRKLRLLPSLPDRTVTAEFRKHLLRYSELSPSIETPLHAFLEKKFIIHTHPSAILALSNRTDGEKTVCAALGDEFGFVPYLSLGFNLGREVASAVMKKNEPPAIVLSHHGLVTWGESAKEAYDKTIEYVSRAEDYLERKTRLTLPVKSKTSVYDASQQYKKQASLLRELFYMPADSPDNPGGQSVLSHLVSDKLLGLLEAPHAKEIFCTAPLNPDHLLRIKIRPVFVENPHYDDPDSLRRQIAAEIKAYSADYAAYIKRHSRQLKGLKPPAHEFLPRVLLLPGMGAVCAASDIETADIFRDIVRQALSVKTVIYETGGAYCGLAEEDAFEMELRIWQKTKTSGRLFAPYRREP